MIYVRLRCLESKRGIEMERKTTLFMLVVAVVVAVMIAAGPVATAGLLPGETQQEWDFGDDANPAIPTLDANPFGTATATISGLPGGVPPEWIFESSSGRNGIWTSESRLEIILEVPNQMIRNPYKEIRLEIGFIGDLADFSVLPIPFGGSVELVSQEVEVVDDVTGWKKLTAMYVIEPNPDREVVYYSFAAGVAAVDYVVVNTICVPEPLTISLLGLGGLILARRRHRS